jgi:hypothetical protein
MWIDTGENEIVKYFGRHTIHKVWKVYQISTPASICVRQQSSIRQLPTKSIRHYYNNAFRRSILGWFRDITVSAMNPIFLALRLAFMDVSFEAIGAGHDRLLLWLVVEGMRC